MQAPGFFVNNNVFNVFPSSPPLLWPSHFTTHFAQQWMSLFVQGYGFLAPQEEHQRALTEQKEKKEKSKTKGKLLQN
jgi:nitroimidazol reductase NimA-like FMN-containing flavoprotein (pyridoxamine 5'-phosphate oxidase superfamily)